MPIDKKLYREAYEQYRQWSEAKGLERAEMARKLSSSQAFWQYAGLIEFVWQLCPESSPAQRKEKLDALNRYYAQIQKLEAWRRTPRKTA